MKRVKNGTQGLEAMRVHACVCRSLEEMRKWVKEACFRLVSAWKRSLCALYYSFNARNGSKYPILEVNFHSLLFNFWGAFFG